MENQNIKIQSFTDLRVWKEGHDLVLIIYKINKQFPKEEFTFLTEKLITISKMLNGLIKSSKMKIKP